MDTEIQVPKNCPDCGLSFAGHTQVAWSEHEAACRTWSNRVPLFVKGERPVALGRPTEARLARHVELYGKDGTAAFTEKRKAASPTRMDKGVSRNESENVGNDPNPQALRECEACGKPLPLTALKRQRYCDSACKQLVHRSRHGALEASRGENCKVCGYSFVEDNNTTHECPPGFSVSSEASRGEK